MDLIIKGRKIDAPIDTILKTLRKDINNGLLKDIANEVNHNIALTCPNHKNGFENNPSCQIYTNKYNDNVPYGKCHCFTCGYTATLPEFVSKCFRRNDIEFGEEWLLENFGSAYINNYKFLPEIELNKKEDIEILDESILDQFNYYDNYMWERHLTKEVVDRFKVGFYPKMNALAFPVWDEQNRLRMITYRNVNNKHFYIEADKEKPVYLLNFIKQDNIKTVYVAESQINALTLWGWGYPAIALFGTGTKHQYEVLNKSHIRNYILCFDPDSAGFKGAKRFINNIRKDVIVTQKILPPGKDVNDLEKEEFDLLKII